jgi:hypothetical protein
MNIWIWVGKIAVYVLVVLIMKNIWSMIDIASQMKKQKSLELLPYYLTSFAYAMLFAMIGIAVYSFYL